ncbi:41143_t:CDS:2, partial [Gigaspora margarita]
DIIGCMADIGWITGHTYVVYDPLACGGTSVLFESTPLYPTPSRYWEVVAKHKITHFYTAPTAILGEPIDPESWKWYNEIVETGSTIISPLTCAILTKPGSATLPFFGIDLAVLDSITGKEIIKTEAEGHRISTAAIESALDAHPTVAKTAAIGENYIVSDLPKTRSGKIMRRV